LAPSGAGLLKSESILAPKGTSRFRTQNIRCDNSLGRGLVSRINPSLLLRIILYNTGTLQSNKVNQMELYTKDN
jgi:hypothetical protein